MTISVSPDVPPPSALAESIATSSLAQHPAHYHHLALNILHNLQYQHDWTSLSIHTHSSSNTLLPRPMISGLPPRRAYIHPDEQVAILKVEHQTGKAVKQHPEMEWVLPAHWEEKMSLAKFSEIFDAVGTVPPGGEAANNDENEDQEEEAKKVGDEWRGENRQKRLLLATVHDDSTVIYYIMHDGIVKPRQN